MGSSGSKDEETNEIKAVQEMDETEMSSKDKMFKKAIVEIYEEIKKLKCLNRIRYFINCQQSIFVVIHFSKLILLR